LAVFVAGMGCIVDLSRGPVKLPCQKIDI